MRWPDRFDERLHIFAHGETFDVDAFTATSTLRPDFVWKRAAPFTSGVEFFLGDGRAIPLPKQLELATTYIKSHSEELRALRSWPGVDSFILGLVHISGLDRGATGVCLHWDPELMQNALDIGITPAYYVTYDLDNEIRDLLIARGHHANLPQGPHNAPYPR
jgi:hypothetical protein